MAVNIIFNMVKHKPPSRLRYEQANPTITVRLTRELKDILDLYRGSLSYPKAIQQLLNEKSEVLALKTEIKKMAGHIEELKNESKFSIPCKICGEDMRFRSSDNYWDSKVYPTLEQAFRNWYHISCREHRGRY